MKKTNAISGFSLVELMVVIGVIALMSAIAAPSLISWLPNVQFRDASRSMLIDIQLAKMTAIKKNVNVVIRFNGGGYTIFVDDGGGGVGANNDNLEVGVEEILKTAAMPANIVLTNDTVVNFLAFLPTGLPKNGAAQIDLDNNQTNHHAELTVSIAGGIKYENL